MSAFTHLKRSFTRHVNVPEEAWSDLRKIWTRRSFEKGDVLTRVGETEKTFGVLVDGVHRVSFLTTEGDDVTVAFAGPGDYTGIPDAFFLQTPSAHDLQALSDGRMLATTHEKLTEVMTRHPVLDRWAWRLLASALRGRAVREKRLLTYSAAERYRRFVRESGALLQSVPLKHVASYLGMSPETLSRVRRSEAESQ